MKDKKWFQYDFTKISSIFLTAVWLIRCWKDVVTRWERDKKCERHQPNTQREVSQNFMERIVFLGFKVLVVSSFMHKNLNKNNFQNWKKSLIFTSPKYLKANTWFIASRINDKMKFGDDSSINGKWRNNPEESFTIVYICVTSIYLFLRKKRKKQHLNSTFT